MLEEFKDNFRKKFEPLIRFCVRLGLNPNHLTTVSLFLSIWSAYQFAFGSIHIAALLLLVGGFFDMIDGEVARAANRVTRFGALYDSTLDRYSEIFIFLGMGYHFVRIQLASPQFTAVLTLFIVLAMAGSLMVSYVRARAEGLDFQCKVGFLQRPERVVLLGVGALISNWTLIFVIFFIALFANITAIQRILYIYKSENAAKWDKLQNTGHD